MRNMYTVLAYDRSTNGGASRPMLGLMSLTDPTTALDEFHNSRILGLPLSPSSPASGSTTKTSSLTHHGLSLAVIIIIGVLGFFLFCCALFLLRWCLVRRPHQTANPADRNGSARHNGEVVKEETLRAMRREQYLRKNAGSDRGSVMTGSTRVGDFDDLGKGKQFEDDRYPSWRDTASSSTLSFRPNPSDADINRSADNPYHYRQDSDIADAALALQTPLLYPPRPSRNLQTSHTGTF
jgi:hypothetical protein